VPDYAADLTANHGLPIADAMRRATADLDSNFPGALPAPGQQMLCIMGQYGQLVGYLWTETQSETRTLFVQDFHILPAFQGLGLAKAALAALESRASADGFVQIKLRVAPDNAAALHVYSRSGFRVSGIQMVKPLTGS
jgi:ribosomal protein S18 acetylase RimI-like enzyme